MQLTSAVTRIPKIGPKYEKLLEKLEIRTVNDLLYHFPFRYDDYSKIKKISQLILNEPATVKATLESIENIYTKNRKKLTKAVFKDDSSKISAIWFNMHFIKNSYEVGEKYSVSGKPSTFSNKLTFISPEVEKEGREVNTGRLVPVYPETARVSSKWLRTRINDVLLSGLELSEFLPENILKKLELIEFKNALKNFHFPQSMKAVFSAKKRFAYEELFLELLKVEERKYVWNQKFKGITFNTEKFTNEIEQLIKTLPFELSKSQKGAVSNIFSHVGKKHPMNLLLEGDVGSGKTIVAVISAYLAHLNGYKTLYMAPTEILANQHYITFKRILENFGVDIQLKTGTNKKFDKNADIIVGTHALLFIEENIENLGLVIIDEQHRFGVEQRTRLMEIGNNEEVPHLLTMTATPIPRTLALTLYGDLTISSLKAPETKPKNIKTWILDEKKRQDAFEWIKSQKKPTFVVCPLIEESEFEVLENVKAAEVEYENLRKGIFKGMKIGLLHGRMKAKEKQEIVDKFKEGKLDVLVATPVIEVGIDIPDATIMVIESAERYGLASLHQLRGRIGRSGQEAYCMLFTSKNAKNASGRLRNLEKYDTGLELAEIDMKLRGQGDIYGTAQHGFVKFKVADLSDIKLLEQAKLDAENYFPHLDKYPKLKEKLEIISSEFVHNN